MPPVPYKPRDIVCITASVKQTIQSFFTSNSHLLIISKTPESTAQTPDTSPSSTLSRKESECGVPRPGVVLDLTLDYATVALFTTLSGTGLSGAKGRLRPLVVPIRPVNHKPDATVSEWPYSFAIRPTWPSTGVAEHTLCLCLKYKVLVDQLQPWDWKDEGTTAGTRFQMCRNDFRRLLQLCERNEGLQGLFAPESWLYEQLDLDGFKKGD